MTTLPVKVNLNPEEVQSKLINLRQLQLEHELKGNYIEAQKCRLAAEAEECREYSAMLKEMERRHACELDLLKKDHVKSLTELNQRWQKRLALRERDAVQQLQQMQLSFKKQLDNLRDRLQSELPTAVKESYDLINLRTMNLHMAKQKNFVQAHLLQCQINKLHRQEQDKWDQQRQKTITQIHYNARQRHLRKVRLFQARAKTESEDDHNEWRNDGILETNQFNNRRKELCADHEREMLSSTKQFRTKGGVFSPKYLQVIS